MYAFMYAERLKLHTKTAKKLPNKKLTDRDCLERFMRRNTWTPRRRTQATSSNGITAVNREQIIF